MFRNDSATATAQQKLLFTIFRNDTGLLTKQATLRQDGSLELSSAAKLYRGTYRTVGVSTVAELTGVIGELHPSEALCWGTARSGNQNGRVVTGRELATVSDPSTIARTGQHIDWPSGAGVMMLDVDLQGHDELLNKLPNPLTIPGLREVLIRAVPAISDLEMVGLPSASACLYRAGSGEELRGLSGVRFYIPTLRARDIPAIAMRLHQRLVLAGYGFPFVTASGTVLVRSLVDTAVWSPERLDFIGGAVCAPGIERRPQPPVMWHVGTGRLLSDSDVPPLSSEEDRQLAEIIASIRSSSAVRAEAARSAWMERRRLEGRSASVRWEPLHSARLSAMTNGATPVIATLYGDHEIELSDGTTTTVEGILAAPADFHGRYCADPLEPSYGGSDRRISQIYTLRQRGSPAIHSFAHGGACYLLEPSAGSEFCDDSAEDCDGSAGLLAPPADEEHTDMGNAARFARAFRRELRFSEGRWLQWDGARWARADRELVVRMAKEIPRSMLAEASRINDEDRRRSHARWAIQSQSAAKLRGMMELAESELYVDAALFDTHPELLTVRNGTLDLRTGELRAHRRDDYITKLAPVDFDAAAHAPTWMAFLTRVLGGDQQLVEFVQRVVGMTLLGANPEQKMFVLHGHGANGKSTFVETLRAMFGEYAAQANATTFLVRKNDSGPRNDIARLRGARLVTAVEAGDGKQLDETLVKQLTGSDTVTARFLFREEFEFRPQFTVWLASNYKPEVRGRDNGIWRRLVLIPFSVTIPEEERDPTLPTALLSELPGILAWAVRGYMDWQQNGLRVPLAVQDATESYRAETDDFAAFIRERCHFAPGVRAGTSALFEAYEAWCKEGFRHPASRKEFTDRLKQFAAGRVDHRKSNGIMVWVGIELATTKDAEGGASPDSQTEHAAA